MLNVEIIPKRKKKEILYEAVVQAPFLITSDGRPISGEQIISTFSPKLIKRIGNEYWISMQKLAKHLDKIFHIRPNIQRFQPDPAPAFPASIAMHAFETAGILKRTYNGYDRNRRMWKIQYFEKNMRTKNHY